MMISPICRSSDPGKARNDVTHCSSSHLGRGNLIFVSIASSPSRRAWKRDVALFLDVEAH